MSEKCLPALAENATHRSKDKISNTTYDISDCLKACEFGKFNFKFLITIMIGTVAETSVSNTTSYLLPSAECDLNMDLVQKGLLNAAPYLGMLFSTLVAGFLTDTFGRKIFLQIGYGGIFLFTIISASSQSYEVLVTAKFFEGLLFAASFSAAITLSAELCHDGIRDRILLFQGSFAALSQVIIAAISWVILTQDWKCSFFGGFFDLNPWNIYLYVMSLWSFTAFLLHSIITPESPKYLASRKKYAEARCVLLRIYKENTGKSVETYPYYHIWANEIRDAMQKELEIQEKSTFANQITTSLYNVKPVFQKPLLGYLGLTCMISFLTVALYNIIRLWFPQLSTIVEHYGNNGTNLCTMVDSYTEDLKKRTNNITIQTCVPNKSGAETYINSIIIGSFCFLFFLINSALVSKMSKKLLVITAGLICCAATLGLLWAISKAAVVALFTIDISVGNTIISLNQATIVEVFPTTTRTLGISVIMMAGRVGTLLGNVTFPVLLNLECQIPFYTLAGLMFCVVLLSCFLPTNRK